jgi:hypothetical protein
MGEIEPIGPMEMIEPGKEAYFTEYWYLYHYLYPRDKMADLEYIQKKLKV